VVLVFRMLKEYKVLNLRLLVLNPLVRLGGFLVYVNAAITMVKKRTHVCGFLNYRKGLSTVAVYRYSLRRFFCMLRNTRSKLMRIIYRLRL
jgi:hypothetical protein